MKNEYRKRLASMSFSEMLEILKRLGDRSEAIALHRPPRKTAASK
jgi:hypothetical protein